MCAECHSVISIDDVSPQPNPTTNLKLPIEILTRIFHILCDGDRSWKRPEAWTTVTHVCRFWRGAALHDPSLWTYLSPELPPAWVDEYMRRSAPLPVQLRYSEKTDRIISESTHRLGELRILYSHDYDDILLRLRKPAPALTDLQIWSNDCNRIPHDLFGGHIPSLESLSLSSMALPLRLPWLCNVRDLELVDCGFYDVDTDASVPLNVANVLDLLNSLPKLEVLYLDFPNLPEKMAGTDNFEHECALAHLEQARFSFCEDVIPMMDMFKHISLVAPINLILCIAMDSVDFFRIQSACEFFVKNISLPPSLLEWCDTYISVESRRSTPFIDELSFTFDHAEQVFAILSGLFMPYIEEVNIHSSGSLLSFLSASTTSFPSLGHLRMCDFDVVQSIPMLSDWLARRHEMGLKLKEVTLPSVGGAIAQEDLESLGRYVTVSVNVDPEI